MLVQVRAPHFTAACVLENAVCTEAAPILAYMIGWAAPDIRAYIKRKGLEGRRGRRRPGIDVELYQLGAITALIAPGWV